MLDDYKSLPFMFGVCLLLLVPIGIGSFAYSTLRNDAEETEAGTAEFQPDKDPFDGLAREQNIKPTPVAPAESSGGGEVGIDSDEGIPTGKYSNPPAQIGSFGSDSYDASQSQSPPLDERSSVELNRLRQQPLDSQTSDYSAPASSNDFKDTEDNSLIDPLSDDSFLEVPETEDSEPLSPVTEPLFGQQTNRFSN